MKPNKSLDAGNRLPIMIPVTWAGRMTFTMSRAQWDQCPLRGSFTEMKRNKSFALCCGAGGAEMFKEAEKGNKEVFIERIEDALETGASVIATPARFA